MGIPEREGERERESVCVCACVRERERERDVDGDYSRWRKATFMKLLGRFMSRQQRKVQKNNNTYSD